MYSRAADSAPKLPRRHADRGVAAPHERGYSSDRRPASGSADLRAMSGVVSSAS